jgi:hypothetical protein
MEPETFPSFEQTELFRRWKRHHAGGLYGSEETSLKCVKLARYIYEQTRKEAAFHNGDPLGLEA